MQEGDSKRKQREDSRDPHFHLYFFPLSATWRSSSVNVSSYTACAFLRFFFLISWRILLWFVGLEGRGGKGVVSDPNHPGHPPEKRANATRSLVSVVRALFEFRLGN